MILKHKCPKCLVEFEEEFDLDINDSAYSYYNAHAHKITALVCDDCNAEIRGRQQSVNFIFC